MSGSRAGCVVCPAGPVYYGGPGYYAAPAYYAAPVVAPAIGGVDYRR
ncbi:MAG: hypothetical protein WDN04_05410 [Rhodospirillales bacterium]